MISGKTGCLLLFILLASCQRSYSVQKLKNDTIYQAWEEGSKSDLYAYIYRKLKIYRCGSRYALGKTKARPDSVTLLCTNNKQKMKQVTICKSIKLKNFPAPCRTPWCALFFSIRITCVFLFGFIGARMPLTKQLDGYLIVPHSGTSTEC